MGVELRVGLDQLVGWERGPFGVGAAGADLAQIDLAAQQRGIDPVGAADVEDRPGAPLRTAAASTASKMGSACCGTWYSRSFRVRKYALGSGWL